MVQVQSLGEEDPLEKEMATHSSVLTWKILWTEELGGVKSYGWRSLVGYSPWGRKRVEHDLMTEQQQIPYMLLFSVCCPCSLFLFLFSQIFLPFVALVEYFI